MKPTIRLLAVLLLVALCAVMAVGCTTPSDGVDTTAEAATQAPEVTTEAPVPALTVDASYRIVISAEADEITQKTADMVAGVIREIMGFELAVVTDAEAATGQEIVLGYTNRADSTAEEGTYHVFLNGDSIHISASDSITLYFAAEAVLETWLTADFGLATAGTLTLAEDRVADLNGLTTRRDHSLKIMSQNLRDGNDPNGNTFGERFERFKLLLAEYQPDIIGTQEHGTNWNIRFDKLFEKMGEGEAIPKYAMVGESCDGFGRYGGKSSILYRVDRFELIETNTFWLSETPDMISSVYGSEHRRICTWALLKDKLTGETILAANTHLDNGLDKVRTQQITILLDVLAEVVGDYPVYLTGDFNARVNSGPYEVVASQMLDARRNAWVDRSTVDGTYHGYSTRWASEIDFVFYNEKSTPVSYEIVSKDYDGFVSDHYGVIAEFVLD